jgi:hypothetical protein
LRRDLPTTAADDEEAHAAVARDALAALISSVDQLLEQRGWEGARRELARGDRQYDDGHWVDAVGEYYSALESGLKHRLDEAGTTYGDNAALRDLARAAVKANLLPPNYQRLFDFADSIRSPRRHGAGGQVEEVEVGPAEALLWATMCARCCSTSGSARRRRAGPDWQRRVVLELGDALGVSGFLADLDLDSMRLTTAPWAASKPAAVGDPACSEGVFDLKAP